MGLMPNEKGNGYIITGEDNYSNKEKEKLVLQAISECLHQHPGEIVTIHTDGDVTTVSFKKANQQVNNVQSRHSR